MDRIVELIDYLQEKENIYLYGAGTFSQRLKLCLEQKGIEIQGYIVTEMGNNHISLNGKKVWSLLRLKQLRVDISSWHIVVAISGKCMDIKQICGNLGFKSIVFLNTNFWSELHLWELQKAYNELQDEYRLEIGHDKFEKGMGIIFDNRNENPLFRVVRYANTDLAKELKEYCTLRRFEQQFGVLKILPGRDFGGISLNNALKAEVELYVATSHLDNMKASERRIGGLLPIQVGAELSSVRKGCQTDNVGDNISKENRNYCECTGLYWIWKNTFGQRYVGMEHYRRRLKIDDSSIMYLEEKDVDAVLALPQFCMGKVRDFFVGNLITQYDWQLMKEFILEYDREYQPFLEEYEEAYFYFSCNLSLFRRVWFDRYCEFAFSVTFRIEEFYSKKGVIRQDRYMGYIFENLLSIFIMRYYKIMNVVCVEVEWVE